MPRLIKNGELAQNEWRVLPSDEALDLKAEIAKQDKVVLPLKSFQSIDESTLDFTRHAVWLSCEDDAAAIADFCDKLQLIAIRFPTLADGRGFSQARLLRDRFEFTGELRAIGNYIQDQMHYLSRCGFDAFEIDDVTELESIQQSLDDFSEHYQAAVDEHQPLYRRRV